MFASSNAFQNDMTWSGSAKNHGVDRFHGKGLNAGQGLPCRDWEGVLPIQAVLNSNLVTSENFIQFCLSIQKLFMVFFNTDGQTHRRPDGQTSRRTDTQTPYKTNHPTTLYGYGRKFFYTPFFLPLSKRSELASLAHSVLFGWILKGTVVSENVYNALNKRQISKPNVRNMAIISTANWYFFLPSFNRALMPCSCENSTFN